MWPFGRNSVSDKQKGGSQYGATDDQQQKASKHRKSPNATPKISHLRGPPHRGDGTDTEQQQSLLHATELTPGISSNHSAGYHKSQSLDALLDDEEVQHTRIIIEGKPGDWLHRSSHRTDEDSYSSRSYYTGIHTLESVSSLLTETAHKVVDRTFRLSGKVSSIRDFGGTATIPNEVFNLFKNLVGAGALGLPSGVAAFANSPSALIPASIVIIVMGTVFAYYFLLMGRICSLTRSASYREAWECTIGNTCAGVVPLAIILMASLGNLAYSMILADTTKSLLAAAGIVMTRTQSLVCVTVLVLLPLCMIKHLSVLAPFSLLGLLGLFFTVGVMALRYFDGTYDPNQGGKYLVDLPENLQPSFGHVGASGAWSSKFLILLCMNYQSFFAHYNSPRFYVELKSNTIGRFTTVVASSFGFSALIYIALTTFGFLTFGANSDGNILNNYSTDDGLASCCRLAIAVALAFTYPLPFIGVRDGIIDLLMVPESKQTSQNLNVLSLILLTIFTCLAMHFTDLGLLNAVGGGALGTAVVFILPALMYRGAIRHLGSEATMKQRREASFAVGLMWIGTAVGVVGTVVGLTMT